MRKLKLQIQMSIDGFIAGPNGEMDWMAWDWDDALKSYVGEILKSVDCIVLGRKLAEGFIPYWEQVASDPNNEEQESGKQFTDTPRVVFSKTLESSPWNNAIVVNGDLVDEITKLKQQDGNDIYSCGGANFVSNLIRENLIDELHLFVNPSAIA
jgi:dihydrofolate reductase